MFLLPPSLLDESVLLDVIEHLPAGVFAKDQHNEFRFVIWNKEMERIFSVPRQQMLGKNDYDFFRPSEADYYRGTDTAVMEGGKVVTIPREEVTTARGKIIAHTIKVPVTLNDGRRILLGILEDITEQEESKRQIERYQNELEALVEERTRHLRALAMTDMLTQLSNRAHFFEILTRRIEIEAHKPCCLIYLDLDRFKLINDTFGHDFGDGVLSILGQRLKTLKTDLINIARIGGDEFAILIDTSIDDPEVDKLCEEVCKVFQEPILLDGHHYTIDGSMGLCGFPHDANTPRQMLQHADMAMYHAKHGRNPRRWKRFTGNLHHQSARELAIEQGLRQSLGLDELYIDYQPQFSSDTQKKMVGMEALVRWKSATMGLIPPTEFIPVAEMTGFVRSITDFVLETVCQDLHHLLDQGFIPPRVSVNISATELDEKTPSRIEDMLQRFQIPAHFLTLEITENAKIKEQQHIFKLLQPLREKGLRISIDDFGTGYSSLSYLSELEIDEIKIDRSFVQSALDNPKHESIVKAIIGIGKAFGYRIVAEGVESEDHLNTLSEYDDITLQGFYFSRPQALNDVLPLMK